MEYTLYIKQYCPYSQEAIQVLKKKNINIKHMMLQIIMVL